MKILVLIAMIATGTYSATKAEAKCYEDAVELSDKVGELKNQLNPDDADDWNEQVFYTVGEIISVYNAFEKNTGNACTYLKTAKRKYIKLEERFAN